ncbi:MAG: chemotaxis protein CheW [Methylophilaceae bacterium]
MGELINLVVFLIEQQRYALPLASVVRIVSASEITKLPNTPTSMLGVINFQGEVIPVLNLRQRFNLPEKEVGSKHHFLIALLPTRKVAIFIDEPQGVIEIDESLLVDSDQISSDMEQFQGIVKLDGDLVLIYDLEKFLSPNDEKLLDEALGQLV